MINFAFALMLNFRYQKRWCCWVC